MRKASLGITHNLLNCRCLFVNVIVGRLDVCRKTYADGPFHVHVITS